MEIIICSKRKDLDKLRKKGIKIVNSIQESLLHKPNIAFITNETSHHIDTAIELAKNGINLFIEKPLSHSTKNIRKLKKIVNEKEIIIQVGCDHRKGYATKKELGGGIALTMIHELDYLCWFFGDVKKVFSITGKYSDL
jgi:predicted dehydrogenase